MKIQKIIVLTALAVLSLTACRSKYEKLLLSNDVVAKYEAAFKLYNDKNYKKAAAMFESLSMLTSGLPQDDTVRYYWALSNYKYRDFVTADANFGSFIELFPRSPFTADARFLKLDCMFRSTYRYELDQNPTHLAIFAISEYVMDYPESENIEICNKMLEDLNARLDQKAFENARLYYKMEDYIAAKTAFKNILKDDPDNLFREHILYYIAKSDYKYAQLSVTAKQKERFMAFADDYLNFISEVPESMHRKDLDQLYARAQKVINVGADEEDRKALRKFKQEDKKHEKELDKKMEKYGYEDTKGNATKKSRFRVNGGK